MIPETSEFGVPIRSLKTQKTTKFGVSRAYRVKDLKGKNPGIIGTTQCKCLLFEIHV